MTYDPERHHRRSTRLPDHDYASPGAYYVTFCVQDRACLFGEVVNGRMEYSPLARLIEACWLSLPRTFTRVRLDDFQVMPNHFHGIVFIVAGPVGANQDLVNADSAAQVHNRQGLPSQEGPARGTVPGSLAAVLQSFKKVTSRKANALAGTRGVRLWQRGYHDRVIRDEEELSRIREYIALNPVRWDEDHEHPANART